MSNFDARMMHIPPRLYELVELSIPILPPISLFQLHGQVIIVVDGSDCLVGFRRDPSTPNRRANVVRPPIILGRIPRSVPGSGEPRQAVGMPICDIKVLPVVIFIIALDLIHQGSSAADMCRDNVLHSTRYVQDLDGWGQSLLLLVDPRTFRLLQSRQVGYFRSGGEVWLLYTILIGAQVRHSDSIRATTWRSF